MQTKGSSKAENYPFHSRKGSTLLGVPLFVVLVGIVIFIQKTLLIQRTTRTVRSLEQISGFPTAEIAARTFLARVIEEGGLQPLSSSTVALNTTPDSSIPIIGGYGTPNPLSVGVTRGLASNPIVQKYTDGQANGRLVADPKNGLKYCGEIGYPSQKKYKACLLARGGLGGGITCDVGLPPFYTVATPDVLCKPNISTLDSLETTLPVVTIANEAELRAITNFASNIYRLTANITIDPAVQWVPREMKDSIFDGNGFTISGAAVTSIIIPPGEIGAAGLFSKIYRSRIKQLIVENINVSVTQDKWIWSGVLAGLIYNSEVVDVIVRNSTVSPTYGHNQQGGISGQSQCDFFRRVQVRDSNLKGQLVGGITPGFSYLTFEDITIDNVTINGDYLRSPLDIVANQKPRLGGVASWLSSSVVQRASVRANISSTLSESQCGGVTVGFSSNPPHRIFDAHVTGTINCIETAGGLVTRLDNETTVEHYREIERSSFNGDIGAKTAGGLIASQPHPVLISESYASGNVSGSEYSGGLIGRANTIPKENNYYQNKYGKRYATYIENSYFSGNVNRGTVASGGLVATLSKGKNHAICIKHSYSAGSFPPEDGKAGAFVGFYSWCPLPTPCGRVFTQFSYWDTEVAPGVGGTWMKDSYDNWIGVDGTVGVGLSTLYMQSPYFFGNWDSATIWDLPPSDPLATKRYPQLRNNPP